MKLRTSITALVVAASLGASALGALAPAAGAATTDTQATTANRPTKDQACQRAQDAWAKLVAANQRAVDKYHQLRDKQQQLLDNGHAQAAQRLDVRLDAARRRHERVVTRAVAIAQHVRDFCNAEPTALADL
jgi:hypothetical protein